MLFLVVLLLVDLDYRQVLDKFRAHASFPYFRGRSGGFDQVWFQGSIGLAMDKKIIHPLTKKAYWSKVLSNRLYESDRGTWEITLEGNRTAFLFANQIRRHVSCDPSLRPDPRAIIQEDNVYRASYQPRYLSPQFDRVKELVGNFASEYAYLVRGRFSSDDEMVDFVRQGYFNDACIHWAISTLEYAVEFRDTSVGEIRKLLESYMRSEVLDVVKFRQFNDHTQTCYVNLPHKTVKHQLKIYQKLRAVRGESSITRLELVLNAVRLRYDTVVDELIELVWQVFDRRFGIDLNDLLGQKVAKGVSDDFIQALTKFSKADWEMLAGGYLTRVKNNGRCVNEKMINSLRRRTYNGTKYKFLEWNGKNYNVNPELRRLALHMKKLWS